MDVRLHSISFSIAVEIPQILKYQEKIKIQDITIICYKNGPSFEASET